MLIDLIKANRSYRGYDHSRKVTREELLKMVEAARLCPSSVNIQPFLYFLAYEPEVVAAVQAETKWAKGLPELKLPHPGKEPAAFIVICQDTAIHPNLSRFQRDVGIVAQTMLLAAVEMGLGGCMIGNFNAGSVHAALGLDEAVRPLLIVAIGKPDEEIILTDVVDGKTGYYRDEQDRHYVPKRALEDIVIDALDR
jgi:nitroreductase